MSDAVAALFETAQGDIVAVRFSDVGAALDWEDEHVAELTSRGRARIVSKAEALRLSKSE